MAFPQKMEFSGAVVENVTIIGAGLGGLATAIALRNQGINVQVYEQARELRPVGAGLTLFPNGLKSLNAIQPGIVELLKQAGSQTQKMNLKKSTGEMLVSNPVTLMEKYGQPMLNIRWSRLQEILASSLPPDIIHLNHRCISFSQTHSSVEASFDGGKTVQADFLIGADGLNSVVRQTLIGDGLPHYVGRMSWRAVIPAQHKLLPPDEVTLITSPEGKYMVLIDVSGGYIFWSAGSRSRDSLTSQTAPAAKARVLKEFAGWAEPVQEIIEATDCEQIVERPLCDRPPLASWSQGRVTLLGDAAHPMVPSLGQGANTAFEDAYKLSQSLSQASNLETALTRYENSRIQRTQVIQARSAFQGDRAVSADSERYLRGVAEQSKVSNDEFESWLYDYDPSKVGSD